MLVEDNRQYISWFSWKRNLGKNDKTYIHAMQVDLILSFLNKYVVVDVCGCYIIVERVL